MKNLNKGKIDSMAKAKRLEPKKTKIKRVEIQDEVKIGQYLIEKGDVIFVEMEEENIEEVASEEEETLQDMGGGEITESAKFKEAGAYAWWLNLLEKIRGLNKIGKTVEEIVEAIGDIKDGSPEEKLEFVKNIIENFK